MFQKCRYKLLGHNKIWGPTSLGGNLTKETNLHLGSLGTSFFFLSKFRGYKL